MLLRSRFAVFRLRPAERILLLYFAYTVVLVVIDGGVVRRVAVTALGVAILISAAYAVARRGGPDWIRDWLPLPLIPVAYWQMDFVRRAAPPADFARRWLPLDAWLLQRAHLGGSGWGTPISWILETAYALTYAIPPLAVAILYALGRRDRVDRFYATFLGGTLLAYSLLPLSPSISPRLIDPAGWEPPMTAVRHFNIWLLERADIHTSVFPSGHVAASFSAAFGLFAALPERKPIGGWTLVLALLIAVATVYGRYHYAIDVGASLAVSLFAWRLASLLRRGPLLRCGPLVRRGPSGSRTGPRTTFLFGAAVLSLTLPRAAAAESWPLSPAEQLSIARAFAPVLVFHPDEQYFPTSSLFPLTLDRAGASFAADTSAAGAGLGSVGDRVAKYVSMPREDRLALAAVGYRVFWRADRGTKEVVVEYWCHYVYNAYTMRVGWLPYRVRDNHPEDLERLYVVLTEVPDPEPTGGTDQQWALRVFRIHRVVANAHDGSVPPNRYDVRSGREVAAPLTILVERGSHAMAPDINHDGRFTPSIDSTATGKLMWGIRDGGKVWGWYRASYMDMRDDTAVRLCAEPEDLVAQPCLPYSLYPVDDVQRWFDRLQIADRDRLEIIGHTSWFARAFGDVRIEDLTVPSDPADGRVLDRMLNRRARTQDGLEVGFTVMAHAPALIVGKRFFWNVPSQRMPDVMADAVAMLPAGGRSTVQATLTGSYALDATTNVIFGGGWFSNSDRNADEVLGLDIRVGRFHVRPERRLRHSGYHATLVALF